MNIFNVAGFILIALLIVVVLTMDFEYHSKSTGGLPKDR